jgi:putative lipoic acid-binding regulatory protein
MIDPRKEKYEKLLLQLIDGFEWPSVYLFKFIVPADNAKIAQVEQLFNTTEAEVSIRSSSKGNFVSISAKELMLSPEKVIERYIEAEGIKGLISL